jgi:hypothetical protein
MLNLMTPSFSTVRDSTLAIRCALRMPILIHCLVSGHALQVKDMSGQESNGLAECSLLYLLDGMPVANLISLGICAMDYHGDPYLNSYTPGLISDNVSPRKVWFIRLPIRSFDSPDYASIYGQTPSSKMSIDSYL